MTDKEREDGPMSIHYTFECDEHLLEYQVDVERRYDLRAERSDLPAWTRLAHCQCENCPLTVKDASHCPAAVDLVPVITDFQRIPADKIARITVVTPQRTYSKQTEIEEGLRALMGVIMASSACPILSKLKPNARYHLPFSSQQDYTMRSVSFYLLRQYFLYREGSRPDWDLQGLVTLNQDLKTVDEALGERVKEACSDDANLKALLSFFNMSSSLGSSLDEQLQALMPLILDSQHSPSLGADAN